MKYISGIHALNLTCALETCGDWHQSAIQWENPRMKESAGSIFGDYGIEKNHRIPGHDELYNVANHIRALLDLMQDGQFSIAQGMRRDFIGNDAYDTEIFEKVMLLREAPNWREIDRFMEKEYLMKWVQFKGETGKFPSESDLPCGLFPHLFSAIEAYLLREMEHPLSDCSWEDICSVIHDAEAEGLVTPEQALYLRKAFL